MPGPPNGGSELADRLSGLPAFRRMFGPAGGQLATRRGDVLRGLLGEPDHAPGTIAGTRTVDSPG